MGRFVCVGELIIMDQAKSVEYLPHIIISFIQHRIGITVAVCCYVGAIIG